MVELKGYKVNRLEIENKAKPGSQLNLQNNVKYNINYMEADRKCVGFLNLSISDSNQSPFEIRIEAVAEFSYDEGDNKTDIHISSFDQLFPFIRQIVNTAASFTGMPGLLLPIIRLNRDTVRIGGPQQEEPETSPLN
ncbi:MAG: hypothetical protein PUE08_01400 [Eubacteriales bacterium]|nr:hypothetical protein [Eubacteriales bacterium]